MESQAKKLRDLFKTGKHFTAADAYSALTGRIVERVGFKAAYLGGHACSAFHYAMPDLGIYSQVEQIDQASRIAAVINIPLIVDADTLGETVADAYHFVRRYIRAGIAGIHVEDEINPKHTTLANGLVSIPDMQAKLQACVRARKDIGGDIVIVARCDEMYPITGKGGGGGSVQEAIKRGKAYMEAGADALVFPIATPDQNMEIKRATGAPLVVLGFPGKDPKWDCTLATGWGWTGAAQHHWKQARALMNNGMVDMEFGIEDKDALIEDDLYGEIVADWAKKTGRKAR